jgi:co-chaperonin GroES (HSP10)
MNQSSPNEIKVLFPTEIEPTTHTPIMMGDTDLALLPKLEDCYIGMEPNEYNIFVIQVPPQKTAGSKGLILVTDNTKERNSAIEQYGRIVAMSPIAHNYDRWETGTPPQVGDVVRFARFAGGEFAGFDGKEYRAIKDKDILGIVHKSILGE